MLAFARRQELAPEAVDVARLIKGMAEMLQRSIGPAIDITMEFADRLALIRVDPNQLELALLNLALNARDAMPQGGRLTFGAQRCKLDAPAHGINPGDYLCVTVTDTGTGMDEATLKRAAEPFFTTKEVGKGTGLGLSMVYGLAAQSEGGTRISSRLGEGTTVELWLPVVETHAAGQSQSAARSEVAAAPPQHPDRRRRPHGGGNHRGDAGGSRPFGAGGVLRDARHDCDSVGFEDRSRHHRPRDAGHDRDGTLQAHPGGQADAADHPRDRLCGSAGRQRSRPAATVQALPPRRAGSHVGGGGRAATGR